MPEKSARKSLQEGSGNPTSNSHSLSSDNNSQNMSHFPRTRKIILPTKGMIYTLWDLTKKYETALKKREVVPIKESEIDREEVSNFYHLLKTPWERQLDGRFYHTLATMQHRRDASLVSPTKTSGNWINHLATEVKRRATPLLFMPTREATIPSLTLPPPDHPLATVREPTRHDRSALEKFSIPHQQLSQQTLDARRQTLLQRFQGERVKVSQLSEQCSNWELDLLSQMIRDGEIPAFFVNRSTIQFQSLERKASQTIPFAVAPIEVKRREDV